jgi:GWxTD domain-containing protein
LNFIVRLRISFFLLTILSASVSFGQSAYGLQTFVLKNGQNDKVFIYYTVNYPQLIFTKSGKGFSVSATFAVEIYDSTKNLFRDKKAKRAFAENYKQTKSDKDIAFLFSTDLPSGDYFLKSNLSFNNESSSISFPTTKLSGTQSKNYLPFLVLKDSVSLGKNRVISLGDFYPINNGANAFLLLSDKDLKDARIVVKQFGKVVFKGKLNSQSLVFSNLFEDSGELFAQFKTGKNRLKVYQSINAFSKLIPGEALIFIDDGKTTDHRKTTVYWEDKPKILSKWEDAVEAMSFIFPRADIEKLVSSSKSDRMKNIFTIWAKYDDETSTAFNPLMEEFFKRVDYADDHFSVSKNLSGYKTDRGKIFIRNGKPFNIRRDFTNLGYAREIWSYGNRKFVFIDKRGLGEYKLSGEK